MRNIFMAACGVSLMAGSAGAQSDHLQEFRDKLIWKGPMGQDRDQRAL
jgi:hypothetical protein